MKRTAGFWLILIGLAHAATPLLNDRAPWWFALTGITYLIGGLFFEMFAPAERRSIDLRLPVTHLR